MQLNVILLRQAEIKDNPYTHLQQLVNGEELFGEWQEDSLGKKRGGPCMIPKETALIGLDSDTFMPIRFYGEVQLYENVRNNVRYLSWIPTPDTIEEAME